MYTASSVRYSTLPQQILDNIAALNNTRFTDEELAAIDRASGFAE